MKPRTDAQRAANREYARKRRLDPAYLEAQRVAQLARREADLETHRARGRLANARDPERYRAARRRAGLKFLYGLSDVEYALMLEDQGNACKLCRVESWAVPRGRLVVDHNHVTGKIRGLLCPSCNTRIGGLDDPKFLDIALLYLGVWV